MKPRLFREGDKVYIAINYAQRDGEFCPINLVDVTEDFHEVIADWLKEYYGRR